MAEEKTDTEIIQQFMNVMREDVIKAQAERGLKASGKSAAGLKVNMYDEVTGQLIDTAGYFPSQESGRAPGGNPANDFKLTNRIYDWLQYKKYGMSYSSDKGRLKLAMMISRKINRKGTYTFIKGEPTGVISESVTTDKLELISSVFAKKYSSQIRSDMIEAFK